MNDDVPEFAKSWGFVRRAEANELPDNYDDRIRLEDIYVLTSSDGNDSLVVLESCKECRYQRKGCSRGYPACERCENVGRSCVYSERWKLLPKSKVIKGINKVVKRQRKSLFTNFFDNFSLEKIAGSGDIFLSSEDSPRKRLAALSAKTAISKICKSPQSPSTVEVKDIPSTPSPKKRGRPPKIREPLTQQSIPKKQGGQKGKRKRADNDGDAEKTDDRLCPPEKRIKIDKSTW